MSGQPGALLSALLLLAAAHAAAGDAQAPPDGAVQTLAPVTVTASRSGAPVRSLGGEEIDRLRIERSQPWSALDLLRDVAGVQAFDKGGAGGGSYLSIRGGEPNYTLVLLEGAKVNDPVNSQGGAFDLGQLDPAALESIEVHRGALSAVHGADALSGVVHLRLRRPGAGERLRSATLRADSVGGGGISATLGAGDARGGALFSAGASDSGSLSGASTRSRRYALARAGRDLGALQLSGLLLHADSDREAFPEDSGGERLAANRELERGDGRLQLASLELSAATDAGLRPRLAASWSRQDADADTPAIFPGVLDGVPAIVAATSFRRAEVVGDVGFALGGATVVLGGGVLDERGEGRGHIDFGFPVPADFDIARRTRSVFGELASERGRGGFTLGLRHDAPSSQASRWTGRASGHLRLVPDGPSLYASASDGFKLPSLYALAHPLIANPALRPERSRMLELGLRGEGATRYRISVFSARYRDLVDFDPERFTNVNRSRVASRGVEGELSLPLSPRMALSAHLTWMDTDAGEGVVLRSRPRLSGRFALDWTPAPDWRLWAALRRSGGFHDSSIPTAMVRMDGFTTLDAGADWQLSGRLRLTATLGNLFGREYERSIGTPVAANVARVALATTF